MVFSERYPGSSSSIPFLELGYELHPTTSKIDGGVAGCSSYRMSQREIDRCQDEMDTAFRIIEREKKTYNILCDAKEEWEKEMSQYKLLIKNGEKIMRLCMKNMNGSKAKYDRANKRRNELLTFVASLEQTEQPSSLGPTSPSPPL